MIMFRVSGKFDNLSEEEQIKLVKWSAYSIRHIDDPSEKVQLEAVKQNGSSIQCIKNPTERAKIEAVKQDGLVIDYIKNPSEKIQLEAVRQNSYSIDHIENPSETVQLEAVKKNGNSIRFIKNPSEQVQLEAVKQDPFAIADIKNPSEEVQLEAVNQDPELIVYIKNPTQKVLDFLSVMEVHNASIKKVSRHMNPSDLSKALKLVASKIDNSKNPSKSAVLKDLNRLVSRVSSDSTELIFVEIKKPEGMDTDEAIKRAIALVDGASGFELEQEESDWLVGNLVVPEGMYQEDEDDDDGGYKSFGPDDAGVSIEWEFPLRFIKYSFLYSIT